MLNELRQKKLVGVLRAPSPELALKAAQVAAGAGLEIIEVTFTVPNAEKVIAQLSKSKALMVGAGTVLTTKQAILAQKAGAKFYVSPHTSLKVLRWAKKKKLCYIPGCATPTELVTAREAGATALKLFPGSLYGVSGIKTILQPLPDLPLIVTGGVSIENAQEFLQAGVLSVCAGAQLFKPELIAAEKWRELETVVKAWVKAVR